MENDGTNLAKFPSTTRGVEDAYQKSQETNF